MACFTACCAPTASRPGLRLSFEFHLHTVCFSCPCCFQATRTAALHLITNERILPGNWQLAHSTLSLPLLFTLGLPTRTTNTPAFAFAFRFFLLLRSHTLHLAPCTLHLAPRTHTFTLHLAPRRSKLENDKLRGASLDVQS